jgi:hypothetical protein
MVFMWHVVVAVGLGLGLGGGSLDVRRYSVDREVGDRYAGNGYTIPNSFLTAGEVKLNNEFKVVMAHTPRVVCPHVCVWIGRDRECIV